MLLCMSKWTVSLASRQTVALSVVLLLITLSAELLHVARVYSANWDEPHHLYDGYRILTERDYRANAEVPPLVKVLAALPLLPLHPAMPPHEGTSREQSAFLEGRVFVFGNRGDRLLLPARCMCSLFALGMTLLVFFAGRHLFGVGAGLLALLLLVFDPLLLAHAPLISTDVPSACLIFGAVMAALVWAQRRSGIWLAGTALLCGLAMVTKFTGILLLPILLLLVLGEAWRERSLRLLWRGLGAWCCVALTAWLVIWIAYGFRYASAPAGLAISPTLTAYAGSLPGTHTAEGLLLLGRRHLLPEAYLWGLADTKHKEWEYVSYFLGRVHRHGPPGYFPLAFLIKSTLPFLLLLGLVPLAFRGTWRRDAQALLFLLLPVSVYFVTIATSHFDIGARHMMPIYPFLYVLIGAVGWRLSQRGSAWAVAVGLLAVFQVVTSLRVMPSYMAYGNEAFGGPLQVRRFLSDSNVDWGQQLKTVRQYLAENHTQECWFAYFPDGAVQPEDYGVHCNRLPTPSGLWWFGLPMEVPPVIHGTILISESDLDGVESGDGPALNPYEPFRTQKPTAILQDGVYVFQGSFSVPLASAWVMMRRSNELGKEGHHEEALAVAEEAERTAPGIAQVEMNLATNLMEVGQRNAALPHYERAARLLSQPRPDLHAEEFGSKIQKGIAEASRDKR